jgi:two-component system, NtrC family, nitrogen regulation sensor histidine kinase NtrY
MGSTHSRRAWVIALGICLLLLFLLLGTLNAFNKPVLDPQSPVETLVFLALSIVAFLLFIGVLVVLVRNLLKLYADQRSRVLGTRLRTRMLWGAVLVSLVPLAFMFAFSYLLMNRAVDRWFSQPVTEMRDDANGMLSALTRYASANARSEADTLAVQLADLPEFRPHLAARSAAPARSDPAAAYRVLQAHELTLQGGFAVVYHDTEPIAAFHVPQPHAGNQPSSGENTPEQITPDPNVARDLFDASQRSNSALTRIAGTDYSLATAGLRNGGLVVVGLPFPQDIAAMNVRMREATQTYWIVFRERRQVRTLYTGLLSLITLLALFACCWLALNTAKQVTRPVESLAEAMEAIAAGDYRRRVEQSATEELGDLVDSFNTMAADLEQARTAAEASAAQLLELNDVLQRRRAELETIIETIPTGVVTLSPERRIVLNNRAFSEMLDPGGQRPFLGSTLEEHLPSEALETLDRLMQRSHRMGSASAELQIPTPNRAVHVSAVVALLETGPDRDHLGYVVSFEDVSEVLRAQKQSTWKEVARRVAHEIKNPLTPISLNAELVRRHIDRLEPLLTEQHIESPSPAVIRRATDVIGASVETMRSLVDQFSTLAEFPAAQPRPADLNTIVDNALALFTGRLGSIRLRRRLAPHLPLALADPESLKRAISNLIDNAAEAMNASLLRELTVGTRLLDSGNLELTVADTGPGLTDEMRERLFLPYFSTKQRGTGLGLAIAAKIIQEHGGSIRAEKNQPAGARFLVELRPATPPDSQPDLDAAKLHPRTVQTDNNGVPA